VAVTPVRRYDNVYPEREESRERGEKQWYWNWKYWTYEEEEEPIRQCRFGPIAIEGWKLARTRLTSASVRLQVVIVQPQDTGSKAHPFPYAIVAGIERYPLKVTRRMGKKLVDRRSRIKPFIKVVNYNHLMPTRYTLELEGLKGVVSQDTFKEVSQREEAKKTIKKALEDRYTSGKNRWFFTPLRMYCGPGDTGCLLIECRFLNGLSGVLSF
jgi:large subunit ribosomal protein L27e